MKATTTWSYSPFRLPNDKDENEIYICRIAPYENSVTIDWFCVDGKSEKQYTISFGAVDSGEKTEYTTEEQTITIENLAIDTDYEFVVSAGEKQSRKRLVKTGRVFGTVVNYLHPKDNYYSHSGNYLCSPSILKLPDGSYLASMDLFGHGTPENLTLIFKSYDGGKTWEYLTEICPCFWGQLFLHKSDVYLIGCSSECGDLLIGKSTDGGKTFCVPTVLYRGSGKDKIGGWHKAPCVVTEHGGRLWTAIEFGSWGSERFFSTCVFSVPVDADLLDASAWTFTPPVRLSPDENGTRRGFIEGNVVSLKNGDLVNVLRNVRKAPTDLALIYKIDADNPEAPEVAYDKEHNFPSHNSKFEIKYDKISDKYYAIGTWNYDRAKTDADRRVMAFFKSDDGLKWEKVCDLLSILDEQPNPVEEGFQYPSFDFDNENIVWLSRTALNKPNNFHDSNYTTFHVIENFRNM